MPKDNAPNEADLDRIAWNLPTAPESKEPEPQNPPRPLRVRKTTQERDRERHQAKLDEIREQVSTGALVIRQMTRAERATWAERSATIETSLTPAERATRDRALRNRRIRAEHLS